MTQLDINWQYTKCFHRLMESKEPVIVLVGGKRSGKSYSALQYEIIQFLTGVNQKILLTRKTGPSLRVTAYKVFQDLLKQIGLYKYVKHNKSSMEFEFQSNYVLCSSIDDEEKVRSTEWSNIFMEEANNFVYDDYQTLRLQLSAPRQPGAINRLILAINPTEVNGFVNKRLIIQQGVPVIHSTYLDNPFLDKEYVAELEKLKHQDETYWKIYGLGLWAEAGEIIYSPFTTLEQYPLADERIFGLDFGFNNPTALVEVQIKDKENIYLVERLYESGLTNADLIARLKQMDITPSDIIYCDSAEPDRIEELRRAGFYALESYKGKNSVKDGIDFIKRLKIHTLPTNVNLNEERAGYRWKKDKDNRVHDEPIKFEDHLMDAMRYAIYTHLAHRVAPAIYVI